MTTLLVSANACKDETRKRTDFISFLGVRNCSISTSYSIPKALPSLRMGKGRGMLSFCLEKMENILGHHKNLPVPGKKLQTKINTVLQKSRERFWGLLQLFEIGFSCKNDLSSCQGNGLKSVIFFLEEKTSFSLNKLLLHCYWIGEKSWQFQFQLSAFTGKYKEIRKSLQQCQKAHILRLQDLHRGFILLKSLKMAQAWKS